MRPLASTFLAVATIALAAHAASAQRQLLDLSGAPPAPAGGTGAAALSLADELTFQADALGRTQDPADAARAALRLLASKLLSTGERAGLPGSTRIVLGRTLARGMPSLDPLLDTIAGPGAETRLALIRADALAAARTLEAAAADPWRTLRDGLASLAEAAGGDPADGWPAEGTGADNPSGPRDHLLAIDPALPGIATEAQTTLDRLNQLLASASAHPSYSAGVWRLARSAHAAASALASLPPWLPEPARQRLGEDFSRAVPLLLDPDQARAAAASLRRTQNIARIAATATALGDKSPAAQRVRAALAQAIAAPPRDPATERRTAEAFLRSAALLAPPDPRDGSLLDPVLRPAGRALASSAHQAEPQILAALEEIIRRPESLSEPGVVATLRTQRQNADDLKDLQTLGDALSSRPAATADPALVARSRRLLAHVQSVAQDLAKPALRDRTLPILRALAPELRDYLALRAPTPQQLAAWDPLIGARAPALADAIQARRDAWLSPTEQGDPSEEELARVRATVDLTRLLGDLAPLAPASLPALGEDYLALQSHPAWELSGPALAELAAGLTEQVSDVARLVIDGDARAGESLAALRHKHAILILAGRLSLEARARSLLPSSTAADLLREVGTGGPWPGRWLEADAPALAAICRYAEEIPTLRRLTHRDRAEAALRYATYEADRLLKSLEP